MPHLNTGGGQGQSATPNPGKTSAPKPAFPGNRPVQEPRVPAEYVRNKWSKPPYS